MKCLNCNKEFKAKRATAKYCSASCKLKYNRDTLSNDTLNDTLRNAKNDTLRTDNKGTDKPIDSGTDNNVDKQALKDKLKRIKTYKVFGKGWKGEDMVYCSKHQEHIKSYCLDMCDDCTHILKD